MRASDRGTLDANRSHYCVTAAEDSGHLSRLSTITRGGRKTLHHAGHINVTAVSTVTTADPVFDLHNALKADRNHLPHRATALLTGAVSVADNTTTIDFPRYADLQIFVSVNFDPGTGLLCALGSEARFRQRVPFGQTSTVQRTWNAEAQTLLASTAEEERSVVMSFLSRLADVFDFVHNTAADGGRSGQTLSTSVLVVRLEIRRSLQVLVGTENVPRGYRGVSIKLVNRRLHSLLRNSGRTAQDQRTV